jgi:hypothetical protein
MEQDVKSRAELLPAEEIPWLPFTATDRRTNILCTRAFRLPAARSTFHRRQTEQSVTARCSASISIFA